MKRFRSKLTTWPLLRHETGQSTEWSEFAGTHRTCGEGACSRWVAQRPQKGYCGLSERTPAIYCRAAAQPSGSKLPRHSIRLPLKNV